MLKTGKKTIQRVAKNTIGYTRKQASKEWFDEECAKVNEEKNAASEPSKSKPEESRMQGSSTKRL
jgi:hypothetical protein